MATPIEKKIEQFKKEAGPKEQYNTEQQKIYTAFTATKKKLICFNIIDCEGTTINVTLDSSVEVRKILLKHYQEKKGNVTAKEILKMFDVMRTGNKNFNQGNYVYTKKYTRKGNVYFIVIKLFANKKETILKSFYSNEGYK